MRHAIRLPPREAIQGWLKGLAAAIAVGIFLALTGAFNSGQESLTWRLAYWPLMMGAGAAVGGVIAHLFTTWSALDERPILRGVLMSIAIALPLTGLIWVLTNLFVGGAWRVGDLSHLVAPVYIISAAMTALGHVMDRPRQTHGSPNQQPSVRFLDRLPPKLRGADVQAVQSEDHYLRIHTNRGSDMILMRMSDAVAELEGLEGAQVHRSWWVARNAVREVKRGDGRATLTLEGGLEVPVSRRYARALRADGWW